MSCTPPPPAPVSNITSTPQPNDDQTAPPPLPASPISLLPPELLLEIFRHTTLPPPLLRHRLQPVCKSFQYATHLLAPDKLHCNLPSYLWVQIFSHLPPLSLLNVIRVCRDFRALIKSYPSPHLPAHFFKRSSIKYPPYWTSIESEAVSVHPVFNTLKVAIWNHPQVWLHRIVTGPRPQATSIFPERRLYFSYCRFDEEMGARRVYGYAATHPPCTRVKLRLPLNVTDGEEMAIVIESSGEEEGVPVSVMDVMGAQMGLMHRLAARVVQDMGLGDEVDNWTGVAKEKVRFERDSSSGLECLAMSFAEKRYGTWQCLAFRGFRAVGVEEGGLVVLEGVTMDVPDPRPGACGARGWGGMYEWLF